MPRASTRPEPRAPSRGSARRPATIAATQIGTLTRKIGRQLCPAEIRTPPRIWPITAPPESASEYLAIARARASPSKWSWMPLSTWGSISAAPAPCSTRARISSPGSGASPAHSEPVPNTPVPARNRRL